MSSRFRTTRWSLVLAAAGIHGSESREALAKLCEAYWYPLYAFVRQQGNGADEARDLTQAYFLTFLEQDHLSQVTPEAGRFRSFLLASLKHFLSKERIKERALKRGGGRVVLQVDLSDAEARFLARRSDGDTPEMAFERQWAATVLDRALSRLEAEAVASDRKELFTSLRGLVSGERGNTPYREIGERHGLSEGAVKVAVHRTRRRFGELLRAEIAETVANPDEIDEEVRYLLKSLQR